MVRHAQVRASGIVVETEHRHAGRLRQVRNAARFLGTVPEIRFGAPQLGEQTVELLEELGYPRERIDDLLRQGVVPPEAGWLIAFTGNPLPSGKWQSAATPL